MKTVLQTNSAVSSFTSVKSVLMISDASVRGSAVEGKFASLGDACQNQVNLICGTVLVHEICKAS